MSTAAPSKTTSNSSQTEGSRVWAAQSTSGGFKYLRQPEGEPSVLPVTQRVGDGLDLSTKKARWSPAAAVIPAGKGFWLSGTLPPSIPLAVPSSSQPILEKRTGFRSGTSLYSLKGVPDIPRSRVALSLGPESCMEAELKPEGSWVGPWGCSPVEALCSHLLMSQVLLLNTVL